MWHRRWLHHLIFSTDDGCTRWWRWLHYFGRVIFYTHIADPLQTNMHIGCMIVVKCDTCKISGAYAHLDCITNTVCDIGNRYNMQVTHSYKERIFLLFPPQLKTNLWMIWHHKLKLPLSAKYREFQGMVIRIEQCAKFEAIPSIMHGTPQFDPFHQFKIGQEWRIERWKIPRLPWSLDHYSAPHYSDVIMSAMASQITDVLIVYSQINFPPQKPVTRNMFLFDDVIMKTGNIDVGDECSSMKCKVSAPRRSVF